MKLREFLNLAVYPAIFFLIAFVGFYLSQRADLVGPVWPGIFAIVAIIAFGTACLSSIFIIVYQLKEPSKKLEKSLVKFLKDSKDLLDENVPSELINVKFPIYAEEMMINGGFSYLPMDYSKQRDIDDTNIYCSFSPGLTNPYLFNYKGKKYQIYGMWIVKMSIQDYENLHPLNQYWIYGEHVKLIAPSNYPEYFKSQTSASELGIHRHKIKGTTLIDFGVRLLTETSIHAIEQ
jgi:hypothetical protein